MQSQKYDINMMADYILGSLSEAEAERFDELSITDDEFSDLLGSVENDLVDSYMNGDLSDEQTEKFRKHYLASPHRQRKLHFAQAFEDYARNRTVDASASATVADESAQRGLFAFFSGHVLQWGLAAAALAVAFLAGWFWLENSRLRQQIAEAPANRDSTAGSDRNIQGPTPSQQQPETGSDQEIARLNDDKQRLEKELEDSKADLRASDQKQKQPAQQRGSAGLTPVVSFVLSPPVRGSGQLQRLSIPKIADRVAIRLGLEPNDFSTYKAELKDQVTQKVVWRSGVLKSTGKDGSASVNVTIPARLMDEKLYTLSVSGSSDGKTSELISDYVFQVVR